MGVPGNTTRTPARHSAVRKNNVDLQEIRRFPNSRGGLRVRKFKRRGGKIVHTHGRNDSVVPPDGSIDYFFALTQWEKLQNLPSRVVDREIARLTPQKVVATVNAFRREVQDYHRLFMLFAVGHCGGSTGPSAIGGGMPEPPAVYRDADHHV